MRRNKRGPPIRPAALAVTDDTWGALDGGIGEFAKAEKEEVGKAPINVLPHHIFPSSDPKTSDIVILSLSIHFVYMAQHTRVKFNVYKSQIRDIRGAVEAFCDEFDCKEEKGRISKEVLRWIKKDQVDLDIERRDMEEGEVA